MLNLTHWKKENNDMLRAAEAIVLLSSFVVCLLPLVFLIMFDIYYIIESLLASARL